MASAEGTVSNQPTGSPPTGEPVFLVIGKLRRPHGVHGEILMEVSSDFPERISPGTEVFIGEDRRRLLVASCRVHGNGLLVSFREFDAPETVGVLRNQLVYVPAKNRPPLPPGEYYHHEILGLRVATEQGDDLGRVVDILETGAHDVCVIERASGKEVLLPMTETTLLEVDLQAGVMRVRLIPGILPAE